MQNGSEDGWLSLPEAAAALQCSVDTVRRRLKRGEFPAKQVATQRGQAWRVLLSMPQGNLPTLSNNTGPAPTVGSNPPQSAEQDGTDAGIVALVTLVGRLQEENRTLAGQVGFLQAQVQQAQETIHALQAHAEHDAQPLSAPPADPAVPASPRPWWKFWAD